MRSHTNNEWEKFHPKTNVMWLHYMLDKLTNEVAYKNKKSNTHRSALGKMRHMKNGFLQFDSAYAYVTATSTSPWKHIGTFHWEYFQQIQTDKLTNEVSHKSKKSYMHRSALKKMWHMKNGFLQFESAFYLHHAMFPWINSFEAIQTVKSSILHCVLHIQGHITQTGFFGTALTDRNM